MRIIICSYGVDKDGGRANNDDTRLNGKHGPNIKRCLVVGIVSSGWGRFISSSDRIHFLLFISMGNRGLGQGLYKC